MNFLHYIRTLRRRWKLIAILVLVGATVGWGVGLLQKPVVVSSDTVYIARHTLSADPTKTNLEQLAILTSTGEVPNRVASRIGGSPAQLSTEVRGRALPQAGLLQIVAVSSDPQRATQLADTFAEELMQYELQLPDARKQDELDTYRRAQDDAKARYAEALENGKNAKTDDEVARWTKAKDDAIKQYDEIQAQIDKSQQSASKAPGLASLSTAEAIPASAAAGADALADPTQPRAKAQQEPVGTQPAVSTSKPLSPMMRILFGSLAGLILGVVLVLVIDRLDPRIRTKVDAEEAFGWPVIAFIPMFTKRQRSDQQVESYLHPRSRVAESYRTLRSALLFSDIGRASDAKPTFGKSGSTPVDVADGESRNGGADAPSNGLGESKPNGDAPKNGDIVPDETLLPKRDRALTVMITSPGPAEGKTTTVANLAAVFAEADYSVFVLNCDFRRPRIETLMGGKDTPGVPGECSIPGVFVLTHVFEDDGSANPATVVASQRRLISEARRKYDVILLDTAPLLATNDASDVLAEADQVLVVGRAGKTSKEAADRAAEFLDRRHAPVVGVLMTAVAESEGGYYYYYNYYGSKGYYADEHRGRASADSPSDDGESVVVGEQV